jgi:hypothetical protein
MYARIIDENNPRYRGPLPKPRGLLPVPPEIAEEVSREQASEQNGTVIAAKPHRVSVYAPRRAGQ